MTWKTTPVPPGLRGVDANCTISALSASALFSHGYRYAIRYLPRVTAKPSDLTASEVMTLLSAGLGVMAVQHVESAYSWTPTADKGSVYGQVAAREALRCGFVAGCTVWLDLEGVTPKTPAQVVIDYCNDWYDAVASAGFQPGMYVGWHCGLNASDLYSKVRFTRYWSAYNLDADEYPARRGVCMQQHARAASDIPATVDFEFDVNTTQRDALGCLPNMLARA